MKKARFSKLNREEALVVAERAAEWLERIKSEQYDKAEFLRWLKQSPVHIREILLATTWDQAFEHALDPEHKIDIEELRALAGDNVVTLGSDTSRQTATAAVTPAKSSNALNLRPEKFASKRWLVGMSAAACLMAALAVGWVQLTGTRTDRQQYNTIIGEQRSIGLTDGSVIHLNTRSRVRVAFSAQARDVYLLEGQAIFKVKHDAARPFRVHVGSSVVQAIGTQFDVYRLKDSTSVAVIEGVVQIIPAGSGNIATAAVLAQLPEYTRVPAGEKVVIVAGGKMTPHASINAPEATAWQQRRLVFRKHTLAEIAAEFNRYNRTPQIRVESELLRETRFSGVFDADEPENLLGYLATDARFAFDRTDDELVIRMRSNLAQAAPAN